MVATIGLTINECNVSDRRYEGFYCVIRHWTRHFLFSSTGGGLNVIESNWATVPDGAVHRLFWQLKWFASVGG